MAAKHNDVLTTFAFLATFLVVMCHTDDVLCSRPLAVEILGRTFSDANVYNFFCLSGYFLGRHMEERHWWRAAIAKRLQTLVVPYALWNLIYLAIHVVSGTAHATTGLKGVDQLFGIMPGSLPECRAMWYIKTLCLFVLVSPLFAWLLVKCRSLLSRAAFMAGGVAVYALLKSVGISDANYEALGLGGFNLLGLLFFLGGMCLSRCDLKESWTGPARSHPKSAVLAALLVWTASAVWAYFHPLCRELNVLVSASCLFVIACAIRSLPAVLTRNSFFIYGSHVVMLGFLGRHVFMNWGGSPIVLYVGLAVGVTALAIVMSEITRRIMPSLYAPLVGGRL